MDFDGTLSLYEEMAAKGDGQFAIAAALLHLAKAQGQMRVDLISGSGGKSGPLTRIQSSLESLADALERK